MAPGDPKKFCLNALNGTFFQSRKPEPGYYGFPLLTWSVIRHKTLNRKSDGLTVPTPRAPRNNVGGGKPYTRTVPWTFAPHSPQHCSGGCGGFYGEFVPPQTRFKVGTHSSPVRASLFDTLRFFVFFAIPPLSDTTCKSAIISDPPRQSTFPNNGSLRSAHVR